MQSAADKLECANRRLAKRSNCALREERGGIRGKQWVEGIRILAQVENSHAAIHGGVGGILKPDVRGAREEQELHDVRYEIRHHQYRRFL